MALFPRSILTDHVGACRTQSLYKETNTSALSPIMTLSDADYDKNGIRLPSLKRLYLEISDPTEYKFAIDVFGYWYFWERQCANKAIFKYVQVWRDELEVKLRSEAVLALHETAVDGGSKGVAAAKFIAEKGWAKRSGAGRPTKDELERERRIEAGIQEEFENDAERLGVQH